ncbi:MAG: aldo/keto reductase [Propionibacteriaceae bacterium]|nr:aldo/keto reductase [Propionibacteriaceae bacterium]
MNVPNLILSNGVPIPAMGLGTWPVRGDEGVATVRTALQLGYRLVDTAENYENETEVGQGIRESGVPREEVFITTKFNRKWHSVDGARQAAQNAMKKLGTNYIDLLLIHWPNPDQDMYVEAFKGLMKLLDDGVIRAMGCSNFKPAHLDRIFAETGATPHVNQINLNVWTQRRESAEYNKDHNILTESWSPIKPASMLQDPVVVRIATDHSATPAQVILRWHTQHGYLPVPKSSNPARQAENLASWDLTLSTPDMAALDALDKGEDHVTDSDSFGH